MHSLLQSGRQPKEGVGDSDTLKTAPQSGLWSAAAKLFLPDITITLCGEVHGINSKTGCNTKQAADGRIMMRAIMI